MLTDPAPLLTRHLAPMRHDRQSLAYVLFSSACLQRPDAFLIWQAQAQQREQQLFPSSPLRGAHRGLRPPLRRLRQPSVQQGSRRLQQALGDPPEQAASGESAPSALAPLAQTPMWTPRMVRMDSRLQCMGACMLHSRMEKDLDGAGAQQGERPWQNAVSQNAYRKLRRVAWDCGSDSRGLSAGIAVCEHGATAACNTCQAGWQGSNCDACVTDQVCAATLDDSSATCNTGLLYTK